MSSKKKRRLPSRPPCREPGSDDGIDPRYYFRPASDDRRADRKVLQLCAQVAKAVRLTLDGALDDERLHALEVVRVEPAPDARRLRVILGLGAGPPAPIEGLQACLRRAAPRVRQAVAQAIHRRRAPDLVFEVRPDVGGAS